MSVDFSYILVVFSYIDGFLGFNWLNLQLGTHRNPLLIMSLQFALVLLRSNFVSSKKRRKSGLLQSPPETHAEGGWSCMLSFFLGRTVLWRKIGSFTVVFKSCIVMIMYQSNATPSRAFQFLENICSNPPPRAEKQFKCPIKGRFQVIKCPHPRELSRFNVLPFQ